jgi:hypothetical protein
VVYSPTTLYIKGVGSITPECGGYGKEYELAFVGSTGKRWDTSYSVTPGLGDWVFESSYPLPTGGGVVDDAVTVVVEAVADFDSGRR